MIPTTALQKLLKLKKRIKAVGGGTGASKTIGILQILIDKSQRDSVPKKTSVVSKTFPHLEKGAITDFKNILEQHNYFKRSLWNESRHFYTFETGSIMEFFSADEWEKVKGPRRDRLFINEANNITYQDFEQLEVRTNDEIWFDWNPDIEYWFYDKVLNSEDYKDIVDFITLTYLDNEGLPLNIKESIERRRNNKSWWQVYGLGQLGEVESMIYKGWKQIDEIPHEARLWRRGLDFGYTNDPTVIEDIYEYDGGFIVDESLYQKGLSNKAIFDNVNNMPEPQTLIIADSAEPKSIDELSAYGLNIIGATKGPGSVYQGIQFVQAQKISITARSVKTIKAYKNYIFDTDKSGKIINVPDDSNHEWSNPMDSIRYGFNGVGTKSLLNQQIQRHFEITRERMARDSNK